MKILDAGLAGSPSSATHPLTWDDLTLSAPWPAVIDLLVPNTAPKAAQIAALRDHRILDIRRNLIVSAPTNSGKTLLAWLVLLTAVRRRRRALFIVPMRAIAREKADEIERVAPELRALLAAPLTVTVSTGDYAIEDQTLADPPPDAGELIIATPERIEAIFRNPRYAAWLASIDVVCVDEAHLIGVPGRGPTIEHVVTSFLTLAAPPRIVCLSATVGDTSKAETWLAPCDTIRTTERQPALHKHVVALDPTDEKNQVLLDLAGQVLVDPVNTLLVFVYQTRSAEAMAARINDLLSADDKNGHHLAQAYHAQMSPSIRQATLSGYYAGETRCLVTTTSLALGVNLPASHVIVRDITFPGAGQLSSSDLLQMMGRAGRGTRPGHASVIVALSDGRSPEAVADALRHEQVDDFRSASERTAMLSHSLQDSAIVPVVANLVVGILARRGDVGATHADLNTYLARSLGGYTFANHLSSALAWLTDPFRLLAFPDDAGHYHLTVLGASAACSFLPLDLAAGFAQLIRDLLTVDSTDALLTRWQAIDTLIVLQLLHARTPHLRPYSAALAEQLHGWIERSPENASMLYAGWIRGAEHASLADELLGSLGLDSRSVRAGGKSNAQRQAIQALFGAVLLSERARGKSIGDIHREWRIQNLDGVEARWRDDFLWLLSGLQELLDVRTFYYHLRQHCDASPERVQRVKRILGQMRYQTYQLRDELKYCSPLGSLLFSLRAQYTHVTGPVLGHGTIDRLEAVGYLTPSDLAGATVTELIHCGVKPKFARQIYHYYQRRMG